ncbi:MAG: hypothetical protein GYB58_21440 [Gammaproteobacteria bacterium]|nr:hypothetical protein [Gammaproteobacteria bacterium]
MMINRRQFLKGASAISLMSIFPTFASKANSLPTYDGDWQPLFNGQDLTGWNIFDEQSGLSNSSKLINGVFQGSCRLSC